MLRGATVSFPSDIPIRPKSSSRRLQRTLREAGSPWLYREPVQPLLATPTVKLSGNEAGISFAQESRKPPFSLALQSCLKLPLHKLGIPRVRHRVHETNTVGQKQLDKTIVHGVHALRGSDLKQSRYLLKTPVPDTRRDSRVHNHQF